VILPNVIAFRPPEKQLRNINLTVHPTRGKHRRWGSSGALCETSTDVGHHHSKSQHL